MALTKAKLIADNAVKAVHIDETDTGITLAQLNVTGDITATNVAGTLSTAAQPNITSVGTLSSLSVSGNLTVDTNTLFVNASSNNVGIGTINPTSAAAGRTTNVIRGTSSEIILQSSSATDGTIQGFALTSAGSDGYFINRLDGNLIFITGGSGNTERMRIDSSGNVGIGTTSPDAIFHIAKSNAGGLGGQIVIDNPVTSTLGNTVELSFLTDSGASGAGVRNGRIKVVNENAGSGAANMQFWTWNGSSEGERMRINSSGNVLINHTNTAKGNLDVASDANAVPMVIRGRSSDGEGQVEFWNYAGSTRYGVLGSTSNYSYFGSIANTSLFFLTNSTERLRITSAGNVGIGTSSPAAKLTVLSSTSGDGIYLPNTNNAYPTPSTGYTDIRATFYDYLTGQQNGGESIIRLGSENAYSTSRNSYISFQTSSGGTGTSTERMRITSGGDVLIGSTTSFGTIPSPKTCLYSGIVMKGSDPNDNGSGSIEFITGNTSARSWLTSTSSFSYYIFDADLSHHARLDQNPTAWAFGSDARLKEDIVDINYGLSTVLDLKPRRFTFKQSKKNTIGFIAQELRNVVPEAVSGEEQEILETDTNVEISKKTLGVSQDTIIPVLVKAIQELKDIVDQQQIEIDNLKAQLNG